LVLIRDFSYVETTRPPPDNPVLILNLALLFMALAALLFAGAVYRRAKAETRLDPVTGALNRGGFIEVLEDESKRARRYLHPLTVAYVDLDDFKLVNDLLGHEAGNSCLETVAHTMQDTLREVDFVARIGGDEFALLLSEAKAEAVRAVLNKLQTALLETMQTKNWRVTFSIGAVTFGEPLGDPVEMMAKADELMYSVKLSGKNRIEHSIVNRASDMGRLVRCSKCRTSFAAASDGCPICGGTALLDLHTADEARTQRGVRAYIANLEGELTASLRTMETVLDVLVEAGTSQLADGVLHLSIEHVQKIAAAAGAPQAFAQNGNTGDAHAPRLTVKHKIAELKAFAATRGR
jgi:diguanylate cyclase (GGDEF)-like protein